jgi:hypothetical protein
MAQKGLVAEAAMVVMMKTESAVRKNTFGIPLDEGTSTLC